MIRPLALVALSMICAATPALAVLPHEMLADPAQEERARALSKELRCQVCQNQSIDDSNAPLAADLRQLVRERIVAGDSDAQIFAFLVARYGDNVLLRPPVRPSTWPLWFGPFGVLVVAGAALALWFRRRATASPSAATAPLALDEERRLAALLDEHDEGRS